MAEDAVVVWTAVGAAIGWAAEIVVAIGWAEVAAIGWAAKCAVELWKSAGAVDVCKSAD